MDPSQSLAEGDISEEEGKTSRTQYKHDRVKHGDLPAMAA
jgi:hypothetical protein